MIAEGLKELAKPRTALHPHPENPRKGDIGAIKKSLEEFGQVKPIVAQPDGTIVAGHHVWYAAGELGWDEVAVVQPDLSDGQARRYLLADNRLAERGDYDQAMLGVVLAEIKDTGGLEGTGWVESDVDKLLSEMEEYEPEEPELPEEAPVEDDGGEEMEWQAAMPMREIVLMLKSEEFERLVEQLRELKTAWGIDATTAAIREAIRRQHEAIAT